MIWKNCIALPAIVPRRRIVATALLYGLSLTVRFTSATGEEVAIPPQAIMSRDGGPFAYLAAPLVSAQEIALYRGWPGGSGGCRAACESPMPTSPMPGCSPHP